MLNLKIKIKKFLFRSKYYTAIFMVLFMFVVSSFSVSASSLLSDGQYVHSFTGVPIIFDMTLNYTDEYYGSDYINSSYTFVPTFSDSISDDLHFLDRSSSRSDAYGDGVYDDYIESSNFYSYSSNFSNYNELYDYSFIPIGYNALNEIVGSVKVENEFSFVNFSDLSFLSSDHFEFFIRASDFSIWTNSSGFGGTELFFDFSLTDYISPDFTLGDLRIGYSDYDDPDQITYITLSPDVYLNEEGFLFLEPSLLGIDDPDTYLYIHEFSLSVDYGRYVGDLLEGAPFAFTTVYTFNPDLYYEAFGYVPDNPAVPLQSYTNWIATAVSGFFDLEITPGFSVGGIFMTLLAFVCVIWFLKLVAGG